MLWCEQQVFNDIASATPLVGWYTLSTLARAMSEGVTPFRCAEAAQLSAAVLKAASASAAFSSVADQASVVEALCAALTKVLTTVADKLENKSSIKINAQRQKDFLKVVKSLLQVSLDFTCRGSRPSSFGVACGCSTRCSYCGERFYNCVWVCAQL